MTTATADRKSLNIIREKATSNIAMVMTLVSFSMLFATLMLGYVSYRFTSEVWPPLGMERASLELPTLSTLIILLSSLTYYMLESSFLSRDTKKFQLFYLSTLLLGFGFMISQLLLWNNLQLSGIYVDSTVFASIIYGFTWIHAAHVVGGIVALFLLIPSLFNKRETHKSEIWIKGVGQFWHFLGIVWVIIYFSIFVF